ncbi:hypothetical protein D3OALGA1CA_451 [Olavius algarvensis associated proteobacterium Delta 3]|nr:hypothetical protein D3OALGA1CA_451 [Olavius algarvensis associated proteobacterium Delta 3]
MAESKRDIPPSGRSMDETPGYGSFILGVLGNCKFQAFFDT